MAPHWFPQWMLLCVYYASVWYVQHHSQHHSRHFFIPGDVHGLVHFTPWCLSFYICATQTHVYIPRRHNTYTLFFSSYIFSRSRMAPALRGEGAKFAHAHYAVATAGKLPAVVLFWFNYLASFGLWVLSPHILFTSARAVLSWWKGGVCPPPGICIFSLKAFKLVSAPSKGRRASILRSAHSVYWSFGPFPRDFGQRWVRKCVWKWEMLRCWRTLSQIIRPLWKQLIGEIFKYFQCAQILGCYL